MGEVEPLLLRIPQLDTIQAMLESILGAKPAAHQEWYTLEQAWRRKHAAVIEEGSVSFRTFACTQAMQPKGGKPDAWISRRKVWREDAVLAWLAVTDDTLPSYLAENNPAAKVPERIARHLRGKSVASRNLIETTT